MLRFAVCFALLCGAAALAPSRVSRARTTLEARKTKEELQELAKMMNADIDTDAMRAKQAQLGDIENVGVKVLAPPLAFAGIALAVQAFAESHQVVSSVVPT
ncbi:hypothetical protein M885DRAFT_532298 [Pelagophyceae sp. CCMP2097]|nr:hypothetical protein M885DRAFT_532298 [Pelagophyceae sp. CCMP2097]